MPNQRNHFIATCTFAFCKFWTYSMKLRGGGLVLKMVKTLFPKIRRYYIDYPSFGVVSVPFLDYEWVAQCARGPSEHGLIAALNRFIKPTSIVWNVGANSGFFAVALFVRSNPARLILFEPNPEHVETLQSIQRSKPGIDVRMTGLSDCENQASLYIPGGPGSGSSCASLDHGIADRAGTSVYRCTVQLEIGDALVAEGVVPGPTVITMDTEGHELAALRGLADTIKQYRPVIALEHLFLKDEDIMRAKPPRYDLFTIHDKTGELCPGIIRSAGHNSVFVPEEAVPENT